jgi:hypothetical protein
MTLGWRWPAIAFALEGTIRRGLGANTKPTAFAPARTAALASSRRVMPQILTKVDPLKLRSPVELVDFKLRSPVELRDFKLRSPVELRDLKLRSPVELVDFKLRSPVELRGVPSFSVAVVP